MEESITLRVGGRFVNAPSGFRLLRHERLVAFRILFVTYRAVSSQNSMIVMSSELQMA